MRYFSVPEWEMCMWQEEIGGASYIALNVNAVAVAEVYWIIVNFGEENE